MKIQENISLAPYTTFKIGGPARFFCLVKDEDELIKAVEFANEKGLRILVLGGGSNVLVSDDGFDGLVVKMEVKGMEVANVPSNKSTVFLKVAAGEPWDGFVDHAVSKGFYGAENLSAIPGTVGAAPVQNIGAYGVEVGQIIKSVRAYDLKTSKFLELTNEECKFGYRDSIFKQEKGRYVITSVVFELKKEGKLNMEYKDIKEFFAKIADSVVTLESLREAIIKIRAGKLPDWSKWGTAGSYFKNPTISEGQFIELKSKYADLPGFPDGNGNVKVSLGWILDKICNARGLTIGNAGVYENQALVLVAKPGAKAREVVALSERLMNEVKEKTGIEIEAEVQWVC